MEEGEYVASAVEWIQQNETILRDDELSYFYDTFDDSTRSNWKPLLGKK